MHAHHKALPRCLPCPTAPCRSLGWMKTLQRRSAVACQPCSCTRWRWGRAHWSQSWQRWAPLMPQSSSAQAAAATAAAAQMAAVEAAAVQAWRAAGGSQRALRSCCACCGQAASCVCRRHWQMRQRCGWRFRRLAWLCRHGSAQTAGRRGWWRSRQQQQQTSAEHANIAAQQPALAT